MDANFNELDPAMTDGSVPLPRNSVLPRAVRTPPESTPPSAFPFGLLAELPPSMRPRIPRRARPPKGGKP